LLLLAAAIPLSIAVRARAQSDKPAEAKATESNPAEARPPQIRKTFFLEHAKQQNDLNDIQTDLRNMLPRARVFGVASQSAISVSGTAEEIQTAQQMISELDRPKKVYRLTYTITQFDDGKRAGSQSFSLIVPADGRSDLKQGIKVPIVTGSTDAGSSASSAQVNTQVQYLEVGLKIEATLSGTSLHTKLEQSSVAEEKSGMGAQDPIVHQTVLEGVSTLTQGKPMVLGSLDFPGTTRREDIEVAAETVQ
jgi:type II secretory pathway component GspD/PulD (secretin)